MTHDADRDDAIELSTMIGRSPHCAHELPRPVLLPVEQVVNFGRDPADSCPMRSHQRVGAVAHVCVGTHVGVHT